MQYFLKKFCEYVRMETQTKGMKILREKYLKNMLNNQSLTAKKYFMELKDIELKDRKEKIKTKIIMSKDDIEKFEELEMKKLRPIKRNLFDKLIKQNVMRNKPKIIRDKLKDQTIRDKLKDKIIRDIWALFETEEKKKKRIREKERT